MRIINIFRRYCDYVKSIFYARRISNLTLFQIALSDEKLDNSTWWSAVKFRQDIEREGSIYLWYLDDYVL